MKKEDNSSMNVRNKENIGKATEQQRKNDRKDKHCNHWQIT